jgi:hypothetical protein
MKMAGYWMRKEKSRKWSFNMNKKDVILELLDTLINDCEAQENALRERLDVSWDCYDIGNWQNMTNNLNAIKELICKK